MQPFFSALKFLRIFSISSKITSFSVTSGSTYILSFLVFSLSCDISSSKPINNPDPVLSIDNQDYKNMSKAYFASGCFWCVETIYESLDGVKEVYSGYAGGSTINPNY